MCAPVGYEARRATCRRLLCQLLKCSQRVFVSAQSGFLSGGCCGRGAGRSGPTYTPSSLCVTLAASDQSSTWPCACNSPGLALRLCSIYITLSIVIYLVHSSFCTGNSAKYFFTSLDGPVHVMYQSSKSVACLPQPRQCQSFLLGISPPISCLQQPEWPQQEEPGLLGTPDSPPAPQDAAKTRDRCVEVKG